MYSLKSFFPIAYLVLLGVWTEATQAQIRYHLGFNLGRMPFEAFNQVIEHYNQTRPWLNDDLNTHRWMPGFSLGIHSEVAKGFSLMLLEFNSRFRRSRVSGSSPSGQAFERRLHSRFVQLSVLGLAYNLSFGSAQEHRLGLSLTLLDNGFYRLRSKTNDEKWQRVKLQDDAIFVRGLALSNTFGLEYSYRKGSGQNAILVQLYYQPVWLGDFNFIELNQDLNPSTWELHYSRRLSGSPHNWGIKVLYCLYRK
jgi:hypothetical protein